MMVNDILGETHKFVDPVKVHFQIESNGKIKTYEAVFDEISIMLLPKGNKGDDQLANKPEILYTMMTDGIKLVTTSL